MEMIDRQKIFEILKSFFLLWVNLGLGLVFIPIIFLWHCWYYIYDMAKTTKRG